MSEPADGRVSTHGAARLARRLLWLSIGVLATANAGCLMTSTPQFTPPKQTRPLLLPSTASPDLSAVFKVTDSNSQIFLPFTVYVLSQDDPGNQVLSAILFDYGVPFVTQPYTAFNQGVPLPEGTLDQGPRKLTVDYAFNGSESPGCHTLTLVATHHFDSPTFCPCFDDDYSTVTWFVLRCDPSVAGSCDSLPSSGPGACPLQNDPMNAPSCPTYEAMQDGGVSYCSQFVDEGTP
jgi:hypothetical protein